MADAHLTEVEQRVRELDSAYDEALNTDPGVQSATAALENAKRALNLSPHNAERQQHLRDAEKGYLNATNTFYHNARMAKIAEAKAAKKLKVDAENAAVEERRKQQETMTPEKQEMLRRYRSVL